MKCEDLLKAMNEYVDGKFASDLCEEFREHLSKCNPCQVVVDNVRKTITLYKDGKPFEMPAAFREKLHQTLHSRWKSKFPDQS